MFINMGEIVINTDNIEWIEVINILPGEQKYYPLDVLKFKVHLKSSNYLDLILNQEQIDYIYGLLEVRATKLAKL